MGIPEDKVISDNGLPDDKDMSDEEEQSSIQINQSNV